MLIGHAEYARERLTELSVVLNRPIASLSLQYDSRLVVAQDVFLAYPGHCQDGQWFIPHACQQGACAIFYDSDHCTGSLPRSVPHIGVMQLKNVAGYLAHIVHGAVTHNMTLVAVTGTNGKTSCCYWLTQAWRALGWASGMIGTIGVGTEEPYASLALTTPHPVILNHHLAAFFRHNICHVALEASSIGLVEGRLNGIHIDTAVYTNLTHDHLDYHHDFVHYQRAKLRLFQQPGLRAAVIHRDGGCGEWIWQQCQDTVPVCYGYGIAAHGTSGQEKNVLWADAVRFCAAGDVQTTLRWNQQQHVLRTPFIGLYNLENMLAVITCLLAADIPLPDAVAACAQLRPAPGRLEWYGTDTQPRVFVDYAHTPDALQRVLETLRYVAHRRQGRVVCVFGCGGHRDVSKRAAMGAVACTHADRLYLTNDNPRGEEPQKIVSHILQGCQTAMHKVQVVLSRSQAIEQAIAGSDSRDVIVIAGKGHERYQMVGDRQIPFSDTECVQHSLATWNHTS